VTISSIIASNAARETEQLAFTLLTSSVISTTLLRVHPHYGNFPSPLELRILAVLLKFVAIYQKIAEFMDTSTNAAIEIEQLAFTLLSGINRTLLGVHAPIWKLLPLNL